MIQTKLDTTPTSILHSDQLRATYDASPSAVPIFLAAATLAITLLFCTFATSFASSNSISGQITNQSGQALSGLQIHLYKFASEPLYGTNWPIHNSMMSGADGTYIFSDLADGTYRVGVELPLEGSPYYTEFYGGTPNLESATDIVITNNQTASDINVELDELGKITGTVTDNRGNILDESIIEPWRIEIRLYKDTFDPGQGAQWSNLGSVNLNADGTYLFDRLTQGTYRISIENSAPPQYYLSEFYDNVANLDEATDIVLGRSDTSVINFALEEYGSITGKVVDRNGTPMETISVQAGKLTTVNGYSEWQVASSAQTDQAGNYTILSLSTGSYRLMFSDSNGYPLSYYDNASNIEDATEISVTEGEVVSDINVQIDEIWMTGFGTIMGNVTDSDGTPLSGMHATFLSYDRGEEDLGRAYLRERGGGTFTDENGNYVLEDVPVGEVAVKFSVNPASDQRQRGYVTEFYNNAPNVLQATMFTVIANTTTTGINAELAKTAQISGQITDVNGNPLSGIDVSARINEVYPGDDTGDCFIDCEENPCSGDFDGCENPDCLDGECEFPECEILHPDEEPPDCDEIDCETTEFCDPLDEGEHGLDPVVGDENGSDVSFNWQDVNSAQTDENGNYTIGGLLTGTYQIYVYDNLSRYDSAYFNAVSNESVYTEIQVDTSEIVTNINVTLNRFGIIEGRVTDLEGNPISDLYVGLYNTIASRQVETVTNADGYYTLEKISEGDHIILFGRKDAIVYNPHSNELETQVEYQYEFYGNTIDPELAEKISISLGETIQNIDAQLERLGAISGQITDLAGNPLAGMQVDLFSLEMDGCCPGWITAGGVKSDADGTYRLPALQADTYKIRVYEQGAEPSHSDQYYGNVKTLENAISITIGESEQVSDINIALPLRGSIAGRVTGLTGNPLTGISVTTYEFNEFQEAWTEIGEVYTNDNGDYVAARLPSGNIRLRFGPKYLNTGAYAPQFYSSGVDVKSATDVLVVDETVISDINMQLADASRISGTVTDPDGKPLVSIMVGLYIFNEDECCVEWQPTEFVQTDFEGGYEFWGLWPGTYRIGANLDGDDQFQQVFFDNARRVENSTDIALGQAEIRDTINFELTRASQIKGSVTDVDNNPITNLEVAIYVKEAEGWGAYTNTRTDRNGQYIFTGVSSQEYKVAFTQYGDAFEYEREFYDNNATDANAARSIIVCDDTTLVLDNFQFGKPAENTSSEQLAERGDYNLHMPVVITHICS